MYSALLTKPDDTDDHPIQMIHFQRVSHRVKQAGPATLRLNDRRVQIPIVYLFGRSVPLECDCGSEEHRLMSAASFVTKARVWRDDICHAAHMRDSDARARISTHWM